LSIRELGELIKRVSGFTGALRFDTSKPDGVMRRYTDCSKLSDLGWQPKISLEQGIRQLYEKYREARV
jgi:GDP-L-fucose synthase